MRADGVLPGEDEMYQTLLAAHIDRLGEESPLDRILIERAVKASLKLLRGDRVEGALAARHMTAAAAGSADRDAAELERLKTQMAVDPAGTVRSCARALRAASGSGTVGLPFKNDYKNISACYHRNES